ncbi:putative surface protein amastin [Leishmania major strain Friedlin]|uniref:Putative surface protein amastin n=1 Tax=Leishmania major TaxID=5664 RepID=Q4Q7L7_LEIMA|nr:putative surface protein amastin [Leishmania major strain Friedlin]CAG9578271.1 surface_protein_amastin_-_putative [Leishmania major strain Friedlin]CAJ06056.1 putative surface protein amastin [Leishmania major strain Friedlin]|eukprot:XP_001684681.1 putative surface protein amastin [Leishmania major strain Friedlin]
MGFEALRGRMDVALSMLCSCIVFMFLVTSAPISQFRGRGMNVGGASKLSCVTVWGLKNDCTANNYDYRPTSIGCARSKQLFQVSEAFYIVAVIVSFLSCLMSGLYFMGIKAKVLLVLLAVLEVGFALIPWVCMTAVWHGNYCGGSTVKINTSSGKADGVPLGSVLRESFKASAGYGLTVAAWCTQVIGLVLLIIM